MDDLVTVLLRATVSKGIHQIACGEKYDKSVQTSNGPPQNKLHRKILNLQSNVIGLLEDALHIRP